MFGSKNRTIHHLTQRLDRLREQRDWARSERDTSRAIAAQIAAGFTDAHMLCWDENARLTEQVRDYQNILTRHARLLRATSRYRGEIRQLQVDNAKLRSETAGRDRALEPAPPTPELLRVTRERDEARALLRPMQDRLDAYQRASEAEDRRLAGKAGTWTPRPVTAVAS
jgi:hypothetical protein